MKLLLLNPRCDESWFEFHPEKETYSFHTSGASPPIGLLYLATVLEEKDHDVRLLDNDVKRLSNEEIVGIIEEEEPDIVGLSLLIGTSENAHQIAKKVKDTDLKTKILYGGPLATNYPKKVLEKYEFVDYLLRGESEKTILELIEGLEEGKKLEKIEGLGYREDGEIILNEGNPVVKDLEKLPHPDRSILEEDYDLSFPLGSSEVRLSVDKYTAVLTSRGCSNNCKFCLSEETGWRARSPKDVVDELEMLTEKGYGHIFFMDNNFAADKERAKRICELIDERDLDFYWSAQLSANEGSLDLFKKMKKAGCEAVLLGIESANKRILEYYNKPISPKTAKEAVKNARKADISVVMGTFIIGAPIETKKEAKKTIKFGMNLDIDALILSKLTLKPHTTLWNEMKEKGHLKEDFIEENIENTIKQHQVKSKLSEEELDELIDSAYTQFIHRPKFIAKTILRTLKHDFRKKWFQLNRKGILLYIKEKIKKLINPF